ncbi:MAG: hypothetical protein WC661_19710 [Opitutaceae bacterium]
MKEGWHNDDYFILFETQEEAKLATARYELANSLPGFVIIGLLGWDDFILSDANSNYYTVPTVPSDKEEIRSFVFPAETMKLESDTRFSNKIKWYIKPIIFDGSPTEKENMVWITHEQHAEAVRFWNTTYREIKNKTA